MIQAKDLRIGNYVYDRYWCNTKRKHCFDFIKLKHVLTTHVVCEDDCAYNYNDISTILLTDEILLKCGFEVYNSNFTGDYHLGNCKISEDFCFMVKGSSMILKELKYLHQLQNLYFSLTGKELEIRL